MKKCVTGLLGAVVLVGNGGCDLADNFWSDLGSNAANTAVTEVVASVIALLFP